MKEMKEIIRVVLAKKVAGRWVEERSRDEFRMTVYQTSSADVRNFVGLLRSFRDGKVKIAGVNQIDDLGLREGFDYVEIWTSQGEELIKLASWLEKKGFEVFGSW